MDSYTHDERIFLAGQCDCTCHHTTNLATVLRTCDCGFPMESRFLRLRNGFPSSRERELLSGGESKVQS